MHPMQVCRQYTKRSRSPEALRRCSLDADVSASGRIDELDARIVVRTVELEGRAKRADEHGWC